ncbi:hypothetical protein HN51_004562, partial [Arachis hypogaea]
MATKISSIQASLCPTRPPPPSSLSSSVSSPSGSEGKTKAATTKGSSSSGSGDRPKAPTPKNIFYPKSVRRRAKIGRNNDAVRRKKKWKNKVGFVWF